MKRIFNVNNAAYTHSNVKGAALVESALIVPILILLLIGTVDIGRAAGSYMAVSRITYEAVRYAGTLPGLEAGEFASSEATPLIQNQIRERVNDLLVAHNLPQEPETLLTTALYTVDLPDIYSDGDSVKTRIRIVKVSLKVPFSPLFSKHALISQIKIEASGPYLFVDS